MSALSFAPDGGLALHFGSLSLVGAGDGENNGDEPQNAVPKPPWAEEDDKNLRDAFNLVPDDKKADIKPAEFTQRLRQQHAKYKAEKQWYF